MVIKRKGHEIGRVLIDNMDNFEKLVYHPKYLDGTKTLEEFQ